MSQITTSGSNFISSFVVVKYLDSELLRVWTLYVPTTLVIQGILRSVFYEIDLIRQKQLGRTSLIAFSISLTSLLLISAISLSLDPDFKIGMNLVFALICALILTQDLLRYVNITFSPSRVFVSDFILIFFAFVTLGLYELGFERLLGMPCWPVSNILALSLSIYALLRGKFEITTKLRIGNEFHLRSNLFASSGMLLLSSLWTNALVAKFLTDDMLRIYRAISLVQNGFFAIVFAIWFKKISSYNPPTLNSKGVRSVSKYLVSNLYIVIILLTSIAMLTEFQTLERRLIIFVLLVGPPLLNLINNQVDMVIKSQRKLSGYQFGSICYLIAPVTIFYFRDRLSLIILLGSSGLASLAYSYFLATYRFLKFERSS